MATDIIARGMASKSNIDVETHTNNNDIHVTASDKSNWNNKLDKNQGTENSGKVLGTNANGEVIPLNGYGFEYDEETKMLKYGTDPTTNLNQGIGLDDTLSKRGYAADAGAVGELKEDLDTLNQGGLNLKEDFIGQQVNEWLDEHPEATTTVQDRSLTINKMVVGALGYVTPEMFGAVGDGVKDDTNAIQQCVTYACEHSLIAYFPYKYSISSKIDIYSNVRVVGDNCDIYCTPFNDYNDTNAVFYCENVSNIYIDGFNFISENTKTDYRNQLTSNAIGIVLKNVSNVRIKNCNADSMQYYVLIPNAIYELSQNIIISECTIKETHQPFYISGADNIIIKNIVAGQCDDSSNLSHHIYINGKCNNIEVDGYAITKACIKPNSYIIQLSDTNNVGYAPENVIVSNFRTINITNCGFITITGATNHFHRHYFKNCIILNEATETYGGDNQKRIIFGNSWTDITFDSCVFENFTSQCGAISSYGNLKFNQCNIRLYGSTTYDFASCNGDIYFNNCNIVYDLKEGHLLDMQIDDIRPNLFYRNCFFRYIRPETWGYVFNGTTTVSFINCEFTKDGEPTSTRQFTVLSGTGLTFIGCVFRKYSAFLNSQSGVTYQNNVVIEV